MRALKMGTAFYLSSFVPNEILVRIMQDPEQRKGFLEFCHQYDSQPSVCGLGKDNLFARGEIGG